mgnify:FL=1
MLQKETVAPETFKLLVRLQEDEITSGMRLVGGTALSLQIAHRTSTDLDLFSFDKFDVQSALDVLILKYGFVPSYVTSYSIIGYVDGVKIDMIYHPYRWLNPPIMEGSVRLAGLDDIVAMKLHAIANSGERPKDFLDIAFLSKYYSYNRMKELALEKYPAYDAIMIDKSVNYFNDIDRDSIPLINLIGYSMDWNSIEKRLIVMTEFPDKQFARAPLRRMK